MPTYISLFQKTDEGRKITPEDAKQRREKGIGLTQEHGVELQGLYYGLGEFDFVAIAEAPDTETMAKVQLGYEQQGLSHMRTFEVFDPDEWDAILEDSLD